MDHKYIHYRTSHKCFDPIGHLHVNHFIKKDLEKFLITIKEKSKVSKYNIFRHSYKNKAAQQRLM